MGAVLTQESRHSGTSLHPQTMVQLETATKLLLIVEDNTVEREGLSAVLRQAGYLTREAGNGEQALQFLRAGKPDLVLLDLMLPDTDGWQLLEEIRAEPAWASIPVLVVSGLSIGSVEWSRLLGAKGFVKKPIDTDDLLDQIQAIVPPPA